MNKILPIILVVVLSGCAHVNSGSFNYMQPVLDMKTYNFPSIDSKTTKSIGDTLVDLAYRKVGPGLILNEIVTEEWFHGIPPTMGAKIYPGKAFISAQDSGNTCYGLFRGIMTDVTLSIDYNSPMHICVKKKYLPGETKLYWISTGGLSTARDFKASHKLVSDMRAPLQENSFKQEFIYNGKIGNQAKFIYREFEDDVNRSTFQQDLIYDLAEDSVVGFKEMRLEVIKATNQSITYRVLKNFSHKEIYD